MAAGAVAAARARPALAALCAGALVAYGSYAMCRVPVLPLLARDLGADPPLVGLVMAASTLTGVVLKLPAGVLSDRVGRRRLLVASSAIFAVLPFGYLGISTLSALVALRFVHGSATAIFSPVASASVADLAPAARRGAWMSSYSTAQGTGQVLGPLMAGYLIATGDFSRAFWIAGIIGIAAALIVARLPRAFGTDGPRVPRPLCMHAIVDAIANRLVLLTSAAQAAQFVLHGTLNAFVPLYGADVLRLTSVELGWSFGLQTITTLAVRPLMGAVSDRIGRRGIIVTGLLVSVSGVLALSMAASFLTMVAAIVTYATGAAVTTAATSAYITDITPRERYGAAHGVFGTIYDVGDALGPLLAGILVAALGYAGMFRVMASIVALTTLAFSLGTRAPRAAPPIGVAG
jgi:MFS family permease